MSAKNPNIRRQRRIAAGLRATRKVVIGEKTRAMTRSESMALALVSARMPASPHHESEGRPSARRKAKRARRTEAVKRILAGIAW